MTIKVPVVNVSVVPAYQKQQNAEQKILFFGQMLVGVGSAIPGQLYTSIGNENEQDTLFGARSMLATMIREAKKINKITQMDAIPLDDYNQVLSTDNQIFSSSNSNGFTINSSYTEFTSSRLEQKDQGGGSYHADIINVPIFVAPVVHSYVSFVATDNGTIQYTLDGQYWTGSAWATSNNTLAQSNAASVISTHIATLVPTGANITLNAFTTTGASQQWVSDVAIGYYTTFPATYTVGQITFGGAATATGSFTITIGSTTNHKYTLPISTGETAVEVGDALVAAIAEDATLPFTATNSSRNIVVLTYVHKGTMGVLKNISINITGNVLGMTFPTMTGFNNGSLDPSLTNLFNVVGNTRYQTICAPWYDGSASVEAMKEFLEPRWNVNNNIQDGIGIAAISDNIGNWLTYLDGTNAKTVVAIPLKAIYSATTKGGNIYEFTYVIAAQVAAIRALRLTLGADISRYVISNNGALDNFGGPAIASLPYFNTTLWNLPLINPGEEWSDSEVSQLNDAGGTVLGNNPSNTNIIMGTTVTTYYSDGAGNPDITFKYLEYEDTISQAREYFYNNLRARFAQSRLTEGDVVPNRNMANAQVISSFLDGLYNDLSGQDYVLVQAGEAARTFFKNNRTVTLDLATGTATVTMIVPIVTQLREIDVTMQIAFSTNG